VEYVLAVDCSVVVSVPTVVEAVQEQGKRRIVIIKTQEICLKLILIEFVGALIVF
jgi:hypothetical protein